jgi:Beta-propeller repeat/Bacterial Ig domain
MKILNPLTNVRPNFWWFMALITLAVVGAQFGPVVTAQLADRTKPKVTLTVSATQITKAQTLKLTARASDNIGVTQVVFFDGTTQLGLDSTSPYQFELKLTHTNNGFRKFSARALDAAKNQGLSPVVTVQVKILDNVKPKVELEVSKTRVLAGERFTLTARAEDNISVTKVQFFDGSTMALEDSTAPYTFETSLLAGESKVFLARAYDAVGNVGASSSVKVLSENSLVKHVGTAGDDALRATVVDSQGNAYIVGYTNGVFPENSNAGGYDGFVMKLNASGVQEWVKQFGTQGYDFAYGVAVDTADNVYVVGSTDDAFPKNTNAGEGDGFLMKFDANGTQEWVKQFGTQEDDSANGIAIDTTGSIYIAGSTRGAFSGDNSVKGSQSFVMKLNASGVQEWVKEHWSEGTGAASGISVDIMGNVYVTEASPYIIDRAFPGNVYAGEYQGLVMKLDPDGKQKWVKQLDAAARSGVTGVEVDAKGNIYVIGTIHGELPENTRAEIFDGFLIKFASNGQQEWAKQFGTEGNDGAFGLTIDTAGNVYIVGDVMYDAFPGNSNAGESDVFLMKFDANGKQEWVKQTGTQDTDQTNGVAVDSTGNIYIIGLTKGEFPGNNSIGRTDGFLMKFDASGSPR